MGAKDPILIFLMGLENRFQRLCFYTLLSVIFLIFVGGFVRASGSGMGCPDWPKCFGLWIPPTDVSQLPANYEQIFGAKLRGEVKFNSMKTWIEYVNRLVGAVVGILIFTTFLFSISYLRIKPRVFYATMLAWILVGLEGWIGAKVVSSELHPILVTIHMMLALVILFLLIYAWLASQAERPIHNVLSTKVKYMLLLGIVMMMGQVIFGTQVREGVDQAQKLVGEQRHLWFGHVYGKGLSHGVLGVIIGILHYFIFLKSKAMTEFAEIQRVSIILFVSVGISVFSGLLLSVFDFPFLAQPVHLTFAVVILSIQYYLYFLLEPNLLQ